MPGTLAAASENGIQQVALLLRVCSPERILAKKPLRALSPNGCVKLHEGQVCRKYRTKQTQTSFASNAIYTTIDSFIALSSR